MFDWLRSHTIETLTKDLQKTVEKLHKYVDKHLWHASEKALEAARLEAEVSAHTEEAEKAKRIAENIGALLR